MGGAYTALSDDDSAIYYNPAGLAGQRGALMLEHVPVDESGLGMTFNDGRLDFIALGFPTRLGNFGFGLLQFAVGSIEGRQNLADTPTTISATQTALFLPYGFNVGRYAFGLTGKMVDYSLGQYSGKGYGLDVGVKAPLFRGDTALGRDTMVTGGFAIRNAIQPTLTLYQDPTSLERTTTAGIAVSALTRETYVRDEDRITHDRFTFSLDMVRGDMDTALSPAVGLEYAYLGAYALRAGYNVTHDITIGFGAGGPASIFRFDYAVDLTALAPQHRFTLSWLFTAPATSVESGVHFGAYRRALYDKERLMERFEREGRQAAGQGDYETAFNSFEKAAVLDPQDREIAELLNSSRDGYYLSGVKTRLDAARREHDAHNDDLAAHDALDAVLFDPASRDAADYLAQLRNAVIASSGPAAFDDARSALVAEHAKRFDEGVADRDIVIMRKELERIKAIDPDDAASWQPLRDKLDEAAKLWLTDYLQQAAQAMAGRDAVALSRAVRRIRRIDASNPGLPELARRLHGLCRNFGSSFYNTNFLRQIYYTAAAEYTLGNDDNASQHLSALMHADATDKAGNALIDRMRGEGRMKEAQEP
jgi:hypothetical protein